MPKKAERVILTDLHIKNEPAPAEGRKSLYDAEVLGLEVRITSSGSRSFYLRKQGDRHLIGPSEIKIKEARRIARVMLGEAAAGTDLTAKRRAEKEEAKRKASLKFDDMRDLYLAKHFERNKRGRKSKESYKSEVESIFRAHLSPRFGSRSVTEVTSAQVETMRDAVADATSIHRANRVLTALRGFYTWMKAKRHIASSPVDGVENFKGEKKRERALRPDEIRLFWKATASDAPLPLPSPYGDFFRFLLVTGQRRGECAGLNREELIDEQKRWALASERTKASRAHEIPLNDMARAIVAAQASDTDYVFGTSADTLLGNWARNKKALDDGILAVMKEEAEARGDDPQKIKPIAPFRLHDLRATMATAMTKHLGVHIFVLAALLNHDRERLRGVTGDYVRDEDLSFEKREAVTQWDRLLRLLVDDDLCVRVGKTLEDDTREGKRAKQELRRHIAEDDDKAWDEYVARLRSAQPNIVVIADRAAA